MVYTRQFARLDAGLRASTEIQFSVKSCFLNETVNTEFKTGTWVYKENTDKNYNMPSVKQITADTQTVYGLLIENSSAYKVQKQSPYTELGTNLVLVATKGIYTVRVAAAFTNVNLPVFALTAAGATRGYSSAVTAVGAIQVKNAKWHCASYQKGTEHIAEVEIDFTPNVQVLT
jgi:hypothetical protein